MNDVGGPDGATIVGGEDIGVDTLQFDGVLDGIVGLDVISTVVEGSSDVVATVYADATAKADAVPGTERGSVTLKGLAGSGLLTSFVAIDVTQGLEVVVNPPERA